MKDAGKDQIRDTVRAGYGKIAKAGIFTVVEEDSTKESCCSGGGCCGAVALNPQDLATAIGYSNEDLAKLPEKANMGLSCGNPTAIAALKDGEVVLDLGSGGGFDAFIAGPRVGAKGRIIGVDMTPEMLSSARNSIAWYKERSGLDNVEFRLGEIEHLPVADGTVDVVISNCVINLSPNKDQVWREIARVLRSGGRVAVSDLALLQPLPSAVLGMVEALVGCVAGAVLVSETEKLIRDAGFVEIQLTPRSDYIEAMTDWKDPLYRRIIEHLPAGTRVSEFITSLSISAKKNVGVRSDHKVCG